MYLKSPRRRHAKIVNRKQAESWNPNIILESHQNQVTGGRRAPKKKKRSSKRIWLQDSPEKSKMQLSNVEMQLSNFQKYRCVPKIASPEARKFLYTTPNTKKQNLESHNFFWLKIIKIDYPLVYIWPGGSNSIILLKQTVLEISRDSWEFLGILKNS